MATNHGEITVQRLLEGFEEAEESGKLSHIGTNAHTITWKGHQFQVLAHRVKPGYNNFELHITKIRIPFLAHFTRRRK